MTILNLENRKIGNSENRKKLVFQVLLLVLHVLAKSVSTLELFSEFYPRFYPKEAIFATIIAN